MLLRCVGVDLEVDTGGFIYPDLAIFILNLEAILNILVAVEKLVHGN